jgi:hypothetical protein
MHGDSDLRDVVRFRVPGEPALLCERLQRERPAWIVPAGGTKIVCAALLPHPADLACLFRTVEAWAEDAGVGWVDFELDGRAYVFFGGLQAVPAAA